MGRLVSIKTIGMDMVEAELCPEAPSGYPFMSGNMGNHKERRNLFGG